MLDSLAHAETFDKNCMDCHLIDNFHGTGEEYGSMWEQPLP